MKAGWEVKRLGELCENLDRKRVPITKTQRVEGPIPYYGASGIVDYVQGHLFNEPLLLKSEDGANLLARTYPIAFSIKGKTWVNNHAHVLRFAAAETRRFVELYLNSIPLDPYISGMAQPKLNQKKLAGIPIPIPNLLEQKRIVSILDEAFEGLDRARENAEANLKSARELFTASSKKLILNDPIQPSVSTSKDNIIDLTNEIERKKKDKKFRGPLVLGADRFPEIPNGWFWSSPEQLSNNIVDCLHKTPQWSDSGKLCLRTTNFKPNFLDLTSARYVSDETYAKRIVRLEPKQGDVLYSREGGILGIACEFPSGLEACLGQRMMMFRLRREWILPTYFCWGMNSDFILKEVKRLTGGAAAPHLNIGDIRRFPIPVPPMAIQHQIVKELGQFQQSHNQLLKKLRTKLQDISDLRQSLLQRAFAGELT